MAFHMEIFLYLLPHILQTVADKNEAVQSCEADPSGNATFCNVEISETICLVCLTPQTNTNASWTHGDNTPIYRYTNAALNVNEDTYQTGCNDVNYSLKVNRSGVPGNDIVFICLTSKDSYVFNLTSNEKQYEIIENGQNQDSDESSFSTKFSSGLLALYVSVPCLFLASITTSILLYLRAKNYRKHRFKESGTFGGLSFPKETNHEGSASVYSDIVQDDNNPTETTDSTPQSKCFETTLNTRLKASGMFEYWSASYVAESSEAQNCFAKTLSSHATMKDATTFQELATKLKALKTNKYLVQLLCISIEELPYSIYYEHMECGSLRDFMLRRYQQARQSRMSLSMGNPEILPANVKSQIEELLTFASMIAEGLKFITSKKFSHPALSLRKVLLSEYCECKLYDIYPTEMAMTRINYLLRKNDPPVAWMAVETIFLQEYQASSDVWTFAVLLWELFSLGEVPFARNSREEIEHKIREGLVLTQPLCCPGAIYGIMLSCWNNTATKRPTFANLLQKIRNMMGKFKEQDRLPTVNEAPSTSYFVLDPNEAHNNYI